jgi:hypothetical protein
MNANGGMSSDALMPKNRSKPCRSGPSVIGSDHRCAFMAIPRCHLPNIAVSYPCARSSDGTVKRFGAISGGESPWSTPRWRRVRQLYRPVSRL